MIKLERNREIIKIEKQGMIRDKPLIPKGKLRKSKYSNVSENEINFMTDHYEAQNKELGNI